MSINFDVQIHWSWYKQQALRHTNVEKTASFKMNLLYHYNETFVRQAINIHKK